MTKDPVHIKTDRIRDAWKAQIKMKQDIRNESNALRSSFGAHFSMRHAELLKELTEDLALWFGENARSMPWREDPTMYHTWVSEIMLQQTRVETVIPYYLRFMEALPDTKALASCPDDRLMKLWEGLGYYSRVRNLKRAAGMVEEEYGGRIPETRNELMKLPGIGEYTAGAILSISCEQPEPLVDGNVLRVLARLTGDGSDISKDSTKRKYYGYLRDVLAETSGRISPRIFNQSLMELGALVCIPNGEPKCGECPAKDRCEACLSGRTREIPVKAVKRARDLTELTVLILADGEYLYISKNRGKGLLSGLYGYPYCPGTLPLEEAREKAEAMGFYVNEMIPLARAKHLFTHREWDMTAWFLRVSDRDPSGHPELLKVTEEMLQTSYPMARAFQKWENEKKELMGK